MIRALPNGPGVYRFRGAADVVLYIGRAANLRARVASYWSDLGDRQHLRRVVDRVQQVEAVACASRHEAAWLERNLLEAALPTGNRTPGGQEVPVQIGLDPGPATPGLRVLHLTQPAPPGAQVFGPYLGGLQVRRAVSGLHRIYPLGYTGSGLSAAERAMAAERGVGPSDRAFLVQTLTAVLQREAAAVELAHTQLASARTRAVASESFELAGRIQTEIQGLDWTLSPQQVTSLGSGDFDVHGWSDGVLVSFGIRAGRVCEWSQVRCGLSSAEPRLAGTPAAWREFAHRNADLAAALDQHTP